jgi:hypothetical protein
MSISIDSLCKEFPRISVQNQETIEEKEDFSRAPLLPIFLKSEEENFLLLPQEKRDPECQTVRHYYRCALLIFQIAKSALDALSKRELFLFDAHVADTACHLRAFFVSAFVKELGKGLEKELSFLSERLKEKIEALVKKICTAGTSVAPRSLLEFLKSEDLYVPEKIIPIIQARLLTIVRNRQKTRKFEDYLLCTDCREKVQSFDDKTGDSALNPLLRQDIPPKLLRKVRSLPCDTLRAIVDRTQEELACYSCTELGHRVQVLKLDRTLCEMLEQEKRQVIDKKMQFACYYTATAVIRAAARIGIPILLTVRDAKHTPESLQDPYDCMFYYVAKEGKYVPGIPRKRELDDPLIVIEGQRCRKKEALRDYQRRILSFDLERLIELGAVSHPQYVGQKESIPASIVGISKDELERLGKLKKESEEQGADLIKNQSTLGITHMYPSTLRCEMNNERKKDIIVVIP